jgi:hypothetical protein
MTTWRQGTLALAIAVLALGGLYALFRQDAARGSTAATGTQVPVASVPSAAPPAAVLRLDLADLNPGVETPVLKAKQGELVTIAITSRRSGTLEVHGLNQHIAIKPDAELTLAFTADHAGRFPIHLHGRNGEHLEVTALEIMPR